MNNSSTLALRRVHRKGAKERNSCQKCEIPAHWQRRDVNFDKETCYSVKALAWPSMSVAPLVPLVPPRFRDGSAGSAGSAEVPRWFRDGSAGSAEVPLVPLVPRGSGSAQPYVAGGPQSNDQRARLSN